MIGTFHLKTRPALRLQAETFSVDNPDYRRLSYGRNWIVLVTSNAVGLSDN
jgi:hypothetical protein